MKLTDDCISYCSKHKTASKQGLEYKKIEKVSSPIKTRLVVRLNTTIGKFVHALTGMAFDLDRKVCGKLFAEKLSRLTEKDLEVCRQYGFKVKTF